jgi:hypothetical protein
MRREDRYVCYTRKYLTESGYSLFQGTLYFAWPEALMKTAKEILTM